ncbi:MAG: hypothetical protein JST30_14885 [Armatimonadetes bacterium]|nr:hypothetical protein [Armatimonadota bacterium]
MLRAILTVAALAGVCASFAQVTSLVTIPIADIKGVREAEVGHYVSGTERNVDKRYYHSSYLLVGISEYVEAAAATDWSGLNTWAFKVQPVADKGGRWAVGLGYQAIRGGESTPFAVGRYNVGPVRFHGGWIRNDRDRFVCGCDVQICPGLTLAADHTSSVGGSTWAGLFYSVPGIAGLTANVNVGVPNDHADPVNHTIGLVYAFRF